MIWSSHFAHIGDPIRLALSCIGGVGQLCLFHFMFPLIRQSWRQSAPVVVLDDLHKIEQLGMLPDVVRFLQLV